MEPGTTTVRQVGRENPSSGSQAYSGSHWTIGPGLGRNMRQPEGVRQARVPHRRGRTQKPGVQGVAIQDSKAGSRDLEKSVFRKKAPETRLESLCVAERGVCKNETKLAYYVGLGT